MSSLDLPVAGKHDTQTRPVATARRQRSTRWISTLTLTSLLLVWWLVTAAGWIEPLFLPSPGDILASMSENRVGGRPYDEEWPERAARTMW